MYYSEPEALGGQQHLMIARQVQAAEQVILMRGRPERPARAARTTLATRYALRSPRYSRAAGLDGELRLEAQSRLDGSRSRRR